jgi:hypothetical protein
LAVEALVAAEAAVDLEDLVREGALVALISTAHISTARILAVIIADGIITAREAAALADFLG